MTDPSHPNNLVGTIFLIAFVAFVLAMRLRRMTRGRRLRLEWLWVVPVLYGALAGSLLYVSAPTPVIWAACGIALAIGAVLGWQRARFVTLSIDPESHALSQRESPLAILFIVLLIAIRFGVRALGEAEAAWHVSVMAITDILVMFALGLFTAQRIELWRRGSALLANARRT
ncbi:MULTISPECIES: CcdC protein domain-containing protein [Sphingomonas]|uniref:CcdC protein domain-containing protein n=1 Tax=Sphingomonas TaxID=13687 RepID=UPI00082D7F56|nr:CcdC protein domain-containing protein [Sphingomonas sp. CCH10-B3]